MRKFLKNDLNGQQYYLIEVSGPVSEDGTKNFFVTSWYPDNRLDKRQNRINLAKFINSFDKKCKSIRLDEIQSGIKIVENEYDDKKYYTLQHFNENTTSGTPLNTSLWMPNKDLSYNDNIINMLAFSHDFELMNRKENTI